MSVTERRRVTMRATTTTFAADGSTMTVEQEAVDYPPLALVPAYVADAETRWETVEVSEGHDAGPGGDDGPTVVPERLGARTVHATDEKEN